MRGGRAIGARSRRFIQVSYRREVKTMTEKPRLVNVTMVRRNLDKLPNYPVPRPYKVRLFQPGDERAFNDIWLAADCFGQAHADLFQGEFGKNLTAVPERMFFLLDGAGKPVGTATAWFNDNFEGQRWGVVHWVAIRPELQGKGLAKPLMSAVMAKLKALGHDRAFLITQTVRLNALNLYLGLGFEPFIKTDQDKASWKEINANLAKVKRKKK
jgi:GNAT superfamily N-acetyltransferase